jgi:hypothetical protein
MEELVGSDAPEAAAAEVAAPVPLLRGKVEFADGKVTWAGKWGFGKEAHANKETGKFEYVATGTSIEAGSTLKFDGFFVLKKTEEDGEEKKVKIKEEGLKLSFASTNGGDEEGTPLSMTLTGSGKNKVKLLVLRLARLNLDFLRTVEFNMSGCELNHRHCDDTNFALFCPLDASSSETLLSRDSTVRRVACCRLPRRTWKKTRTSAKARTAAARAVAVTRRAATVAKRTTLQLSSQPSRLSDILRILP